MTREPLIILVSAAADSTLEQALRNRYLEGYRIHAIPLADAYATLSSLQEGNESVALFVFENCVGYDAFIDQCVAVYPTARRLMIDRSGTQPQAIEYTLQDWMPPESRLYPLIDELLAEWRVAVNTTFARVSAIMTVRTIRIRINESLHRAAEVIALSGVGDLMVIDNNNNFVGVLSVGDVLRAAMPDIDEIMDEGGTLEQAFSLFLRKGSELRYKPIAPLVITTPLVVHPDDHIAKAATLMIEKNIHRLPVIEDGRLVGTVGRTDICQAVVGTL